MSKLLTTVFLAFLIQVSVLAQPSTPTLFFAPIKIQGNLALSPKELNDALLSTIAEVAPQVKVTVGESAANSDEEALAMGKQAGCQYVVYGSVDINKGSELISMGASAHDQPEGPLTVSQPLRYLVFVRGRALVSALDVSSSERLATQPEIFYRTQISVAKNGNVEKALSHDFIDQLSHRIILNLQSRVRQHRAATNGVKEAEPGSPK